MKFVYTAIVRPKDGIRDPQSDAMTEVLSMCGDVSVNFVGRVIELEIEAENIWMADEIFFEIKEKYLVNPNLETCEVTEKRQCYSVVLCPETIQLEEDAQKILDENRWDLYEGDYDWVGSEMGLDVCPGCGGVADNGFDRCVPPNPYVCTKCEREQRVEAGLDPDKE